MTTVSFSASHMTSLSRLAARASAAAEAIESLLPPEADRIADLGCGTGIVTVRMCRPGRQARQEAGDPAAARTARAAIASA